MRSYLSAYFGKDLPEEAVGAIAAGRGREAALAALERAYAAPSAEEPAARPPLDKARGGGGACAKGRASAALPFSSCDVICSASNNLSGRERWITH